MSTGLQAVIGLEVHVQLATRTKLFCGCPNRFGDPPNTNVCPVCLGHPGVLPVLNREAVVLALRLALAAGASIRPRSIFARKSYFYPDLPKGYQISQYDRPLAEGGGLAVDGVEGGERRIPLARIHLEEDAGKLVHDGIAATAGTGVDFNRAGVPLAECVTAPALASPAEAHEYLTELKALIEAAGVSRASMEEGSLRCDANVSLHRPGEPLGAKTEVKNLNSFRNVERALAFEISRQRAVLEDGGTLVQQTRLWDAERGETRAMRSKEEAHDYRYFPEPDLPPLVIPEALLAEVRASLPEPPRARRGRFAREHGLTAADARVLSLDPPLAGYYEAAVSAGGAPREIANWVLRDVLRWTHDSGKPIAALPVAPASLAELTALAAGATISSAQAKSVFAEMVASGRGAKDIVAARGLSQVTDEGAIDAAVARVLAAHPDEVARYRAGKTGLSGFFVGEVMKEMKGRGNPKQVSAAVARALAG